MEFKNENTGRTFDSKALWNQFLAHRILLIAIVLLTSLIMGIYSAITYRPKYASKAKILVHDTQLGTSTAEISTSTSLSRDYVEIIKSDSVMSQVISKLSLQGKYGTSSLRRCISCDSPDYTRVIDLKVTTGDPELSRKIAVAVCSVARNRISEIMNFGSDENGNPVGESCRLQIIDPAGKAVKLKSPVQSDFLYGILYGILIAAILLIAFYLIDDKLKGEDEVVHYLNLSVLAEIPYVDKKMASGHLPIKTPKKRLNKG